MNKLHTKKNKLVKIVNELKEKKKLVGFTNGCFDLLHAGHLKLISESKRYCDYLVIGLNSDSSVKKLKGLNRPIENEKKRIENISKIDAVDAIILFSEPTPMDIIQLLNPDVLVKGSDYKNLKVVGSDYITKRGGKLIFVELMPGVSTTKIIENRL